jgi:hypothetical protein
MTALHLSGHFSWRRVLVALLLGLLFAGAAAEAPAAPAGFSRYPIVLVPGTSDELPNLEKVVGATVEGRVRHAERGQFWVYGLRVAPGSACELSISLDLDSGEQPPTVVVLGRAGGRLPAETERIGNDALIVRWTVPASWPFGERMPVVVSARITPTTVGEARFTQTDPNALPNGLSQYVVRTMRDGFPSDAAIKEAPIPERPYVIERVSGAASAEADLQPDAVDVPGGARDAVRSWRLRGYPVWATISCLDGRAYAAAHRDEIQALHNRRQKTEGDLFYFTPTPARLAAEQAAIASAVAAGAEAEGIADAAYAVDGGYDAAFQAAWTAAYRRPWTAPGADQATRWDAARLMADLEFGAVRDALASAKTSHRFVAARSSVAYLLEGLVCPVGRLFGLPDLHSLIGIAADSSVLAPIRSAGVRRPYPFWLAYLQCASLAASAPPGSSLTLGIDPFMSAPDIARDAAEDAFRQSLAAALLFPEVSSYEIGAPPSGPSQLPGAYLTQVDSAVSALEEMHAQPAPEPAAGSEIGILLSDSAQWSRIPPNPGDLDALFGLALPLMERGVSVRIASMDRASQAGYLDRFKTLLLSFDFQNALDARDVQAIAAWVKRGGSLLLIGGADADGAIPGSWWQAAGAASPIEATWRQLGVTLREPPRSVRVPPEDTSQFVALTRTDPNGPVSRRDYTVDLTPYVKSTGSAAVRFAAAQPESSAGPYLYSAELRVGNEIAAAFRAGSDIENRFITLDEGSQCNGEARFSSGHGSWIYQFDNLPKDAIVTMRVDIAGAFEISAGAASSDTGHTLVATTAAGDFAKSLPALRIGPSYAATVYAGAPGPVIPSPSGAAPRPAADHSASQQATVLYELRSGGSAIWAAGVEKGVVVSAGVAPGFFSASERSATLLRGLVQYALQRAGGSYREAGAFRVQRGRFTVVQTLDWAERVEGRTIDLFSPNLSVAVDRVIPPHTTELLCDASAGGADPGILFVSGRVVARIESAHRSVFFVRGPRGTMGVARLASAGHALAAAHATDSLGKPVAVETEADNGTVELRYPNDPDGLIVRVAWQ